MSGEPPVSAGVSSHVCWQDSRGRVSQLSVVTIHGKQHCCNIHLWKIKLHLLEFSQVDFCSFGIIFFSLSMLPQVQEGFTKIKIFYLAAVQQPVCSKGQ